MTYPTTVTLFTVSGPSSGNLFDGSKFSGGWSYLTECVEFLARLSNENTFIFLHVAHHATFGDLPSFSNYRNLKVVCHTYNDDLAGRLTGGHQHAFLLNKLLKDVNVKGTVYGFIDPDCYILDKASFNEAVAAIESQHFDGIGVPYPEVFPKTYYWDFPTAYFTLFNRHTIEPHSLDFSLAGGDFEIALPPKLMKSLLIKKLFWFVNFCRTSRNCYLHWIYRLAFNLHYRRINVSKDTGWQNRSLLKDNKRRFLIAKSVARPIKVVLPFFDAKTYLDRNHDVAESGVDPEWHFLFHGIFENRSIGRQRGLWRFLHFLLRSTRELSMHDPSGIVIRKHVLFDYLPQGAIGDLEFSHEYYLYSRPFCIHLGHSSKRNLDANLRVLKELRLQLPSQ